MEIKECVWMQRRTEMNRLARQGQTGRQRREIQKKLKFKAKEYETLLNEMEEDGRGVKEKENRWDSYQTPSEYPCVVSQQASEEIMKSILSCKEHLSFSCDLKWFYSSLELLGSSPTMVHDIFKLMGLFNTPLNNHVH